MESALPKSVANATVERLHEWVDRLAAQEGYADMVAGMKAGQAATLDGVWGSSCALVAADLARNAPATLVVVAPHGDDADDLIDDLALFTDLVPEKFPAWESLPNEEAAGEEIAGDRLRLLKKLRRSTLPRLIVTSIQSLLQPVPSLELLARQTRHLKTGETMRIAELTRWLAENGFVPMPAVQTAGRVFDPRRIGRYFAPDWLDPVRVEFFGDEIESIRRFEVAGQRSLSTIPEIDVTLLSPTTTEQARFADYLPPNAWFMLVEPLELERQGRHYLERMERSDKLFDFTTALRRVYDFPSLAASAVAGGSFENTCCLKVESVERFSGNLERVRSELEEAGQGQKTYIICQTEAEIKRLGDLFAGTQIAKEQRLFFLQGVLHAGFRLVSEKTVFLSSGELFRRAEIVRPARRRLSKVIDSFLDLREGDLVVHISHGIARYRGLKLLEKSGQVEEHLELEFEGKTKNLRPEFQDRVGAKYVGGTKSRPRLAKIGGKLWIKQKERVEEAVTDMAADMLELQASRTARPGIAFPDDTEWQREFDASFPYRETSDQIITIESIKQDMSLSRPMDRLLCGDVGYGKTEVAMRAVFKAVDAGYQVAVLVPTTILCEQHRRTFSSRMAEFPFQIAALSRFATPREQNQIVERLAEGSLDIVIGTHRLAQPDIRFHNLGLVIIDEEQRFGVDVKERLKALRQTVDVLTMTATPIPRTLHMGLLGLRDISNLETPPEDRLAVETRVFRSDPELIRHAVLRELNRGGQIFFVHNRVEDIEVVATRLRQIVPEQRLPSPTVRCRSMNWKR